MESKSFEGQRVVSRLNSEEEHLKCRCLSNPILRINFDWVCHRCYILIYLIAKGSVAPIEIIEFKEKYEIASSSLSIILGFSKNTISNIESGGINSLPRGRLIKLCLDNISILTKYVESCSLLDIPKKEEILEKLRAI